MWFPPFETVGLPHTYKHIESDLPHWIGKANICLCLFCSSHCVSVSILEWINEWKQTYTDWSRTDTSGQKWETGELIITRYGHSMYFTMMVGVQTLVTRLVFVGSRSDDLSGCKLKGGRRCASSVCFGLRCWYQTVLKGCKQTLQMDVYITKSGLHKLYFIFSPVPETSSLTQSSAFFNTVLF